MGHPVTTNPIIIMLINMTVVFIVLISLSFLIRLIHMVDPTAKKEEAEAPESPLPRPAPAVAAPPKTAKVTLPDPVVEQGIPQETIAVICAAIASYGYSSSQIHAIRPIHNKVWEHSGRYHQDF